MRVVLDAVDAARRKLRQRRWQAGLAAVALAVVAVSGALRSEPGPLTPGIVVPPLARYSVCPGSPSIGSVRVGDRVLLTGRSADGEWVQMVAPRVPDARVWVPAKLIEVAGESSLPVRECDRGGGTAAPDGAPQDVAAVSDIEDSRGGPSEDEGTTTTARDTTTSPTTASAPGTTSTTQPSDPGGPLGGADRSGPAMSQLRAGGEVPDGQDRVFEDGGCGPSSIPVEAVVIDPASVRSVVLHWRFDGRDGTITGSKPMYRSAGKYVAAFGPFAPRTVPGGSVIVDWWLVATDGLGNSSRADAPNNAQVDERIELAGCGG